MISLKTVICSPFQSICLQFNCINSSWSCETLWLDCWSFLHLRSSKWNVFFFLRVIRLRKANVVRHKSDVKNKSIVHSTKHERDTLIIRKEYKKRNKQTDLKWLIWRYTIRNSLSHSLLILYDYVKGSSILRNYCQNHLHTHFIRKSHLTFVVNRLLSNK